MVNGGVEDFARRGIGEQLCVVFAVHFSTTTEAFEVVIPGGNP